MEELFERISAQASELLKSDIIKEMLSSCKDQQEQMEKLAIVSVYALMKANK